MQNLENLFLLQQSLAFPVLCAWRTSSGLQLTLPLCLVRTLTLPEALGCLWQAGRKVTCVEKNKKRVHSHFSKCIIP